MKIVYYKLKEMGKRMKRKFLKNRKKRYEIFDFSSRFFSFVFFGELKMGFWIR